MKYPGLGRSTGVEDRGWLRAWRRRVSAAGLVIGSSSFHRKRASQSPSPTRAVLSVCVLPRLIGRNPIFNVLLWRLVTVGKQPDLEGGTFMNAVNVLMKEI